MDRHLKQGHVLAIVLLALLHVAGHTAVDEGTALLRVAICWKRWEHLTLLLFTDSSRAQNTLRQINYNTDIE